MTNSNRWPLGLAATLLAAVTGLDARAQQQSAQIGMVENPCPALPPLPDSLKAFQQAFVEPGKPDIPKLTALTQTPEAIAYNKAKAARDAGDWAGLCRYRDDDTALLASGKRPDVVFFGDSITEGWILGDPSLFSDKVIGRGIGGQTSGQMLVRFRQDVIALRPKVVHILAGANDVAGNSGPTTEQAFKDNIVGMVELARANRIKVVLGSILPAKRFFWRPEIAPADQIVRLNAWLRTYAAAEGLAFKDYHAVLALPDGGMRPDLALDGVHPNRDGYALMRPLAQTVR